MLDRVSPALGVWLTTLVWAAVALGLWGFHDRQLATGTEVALRAVPVDPRDVLRGDYVVLSYEVSSFRQSEETQDWWWGKEQTVFVSIVEEGGDWRIADIERTVPSAGVFLRGRMRMAGGDRREIRYGIERFYVPEGEGRRYEEARNRDRLWAIVSVSPRGVARLKRLEIR